MGDYIKKSEILFMSLFASMKQNGLLLIVILSKAAQYTSTGNDHLVYPSNPSPFRAFLGVMELARRIYDIITNPDNIIDDTIHSFVPRREQIASWVLAQCTSNSCIMSRFRASSLFAWSRGSDAARLES